MPSPPSSPGPRSGPSCLPVPLSCFRSVYLFLFSPDLHFHILFSSIADFLTLPFLSHFHFLSPILRSDSFPLNSLLSPYSSLSFSLVTRTFRSVAGLVKRLKERGMEEERKRGRSKRRKRGWRKKTMFTREAFAKRG